MSVAGRKPVEPRRMGCEAENAEFLARFQRDMLVYGRAENTISTYRAAIVDFLKFTLGLDVRQVTHKDIREWLHWLDVQRRSAASIANGKYALSAFFKFLQVIGETKDSPTRLIPNRKVPRKLPRIMSVDEVGQLIDGAATLRDRALIETLYATGCRVSEITGLCAERLNLRQRSAVVLGKGNKQRVVLLTQCAADLLSEYLDGRIKGVVFTAEPKVQLGWVRRGKYGVWRGCWYEPGPEGKRVTRSVRLGDYKTREMAEEALSRYFAKHPIKPRPTRLPRAIDVHTVRTILNAAARRAELPYHVHPHMLRHACASHLLERGMDIRYVQELLGHESISTTQIYTHLSTANLRQTYEKFHPHGGQNA